MSRLTYIVHTLNPGGTERLAVDMALAFASRHEVQVICLDEPGLWAADLRARNIAVHCLWRQPGFDVGVVVRLAQRLRLSRADLIHAHQCTPWFYAALARLLYPRPRLLLEEHGRFHPEVRKPLRIFVNRVLTRRLTHAFAAVSADIRERLVTYEGLVRDAIRVIYNGVQSLPAATRIEREEIRRMLGYGDDVFVIGTVGRLDPIKNLPLLLRAFRRLMGRHPGLRLLVVGDGPERARIERLVCEESMGSVVQLTGFRPDARRLLGALDLFAMASFSEGTSMALLEAMSVGLPIVVSAVGGNPEIVHDGESGLLFPSEDAEALTNALEQLISDEAARLRLGDAARQEFSSHFSFDAMVGQYQNLYDSLLNQHT